MKSELKNEKIKRKYLKYLREARGLSESTITAIERAVWLYDEYTRRDDYSKFSQRRAASFKAWLQERKRVGTPVSITTVYHQLRHLRDFLTWLSIQPGYKSKIQPDAISYLNLDRKKVREARESRRQRYPSLAYVKQLANSIDANCEIGMRDRALVAFLLLSGMRDRAVATLPLGCFDPDTLEIIQSPKRGVSTKFSKAIMSVLFRFDKELVRYVREWADYLVKTKGFGTDDPLFPRSRVENVADGLTFESTQVEPVFWRGTGPIRAILANRSKQAGLKYFKPHSYRHAAIALAVRRCTTAEQMRAISQNVGHENIGTTMMTYGKLDEERVADVVRGLDFSAQSERRDRNEAISLMEEALRKIKKRG